MELDLPALSGPDYKGTTGQSENSYFQQEYYLSTAVLFRALDCLSFSLSTDGIVNRMNCDLKDFAKPVRYSWLTALAGKYVNDWMTLSASVLSTVIYEDVAKAIVPGTPETFSVCQCIIQAICFRGVSYPFLL